MGAVIIAIVSVCILQLQSYLHSKERQDLYNRIMAQDLGEYQARTEKKGPRVRQNYHKKNIGNAYRKMYGRDETE